MFSFPPNEKVNITFPLSNARKNENERMKGWEKLYENQPAIIVPTFTCSFHVCSCRNYGKSCTYFFQRVRVREFNVPSYNGIMEILYTFSRFYHSQICIFLWDFSQFPMKANFTRTDLNLIVNFKLLFFLPNARKRSKITIWIQNILSEIFFLEEHKVSFDATMRKFYRFDFVSLKSLT